MGDVDKGAKLPYSLGQGILETVPINKHLPKLIVIVGIGRRTLLEFDNVNGILNILGIRVVFIIHHLELRQSALFTNAVTNDLVEVLVGLLVVEDHVRTLIREFLGIRFSIFTDTDMSGTGVVAAPDGFSIGISTDLTGALVSVGSSGERITGSSQDQSVQGKCSSAGTHRLEDRYL